MCLQEEQAAKLKAEKIRVALEKIKEAQVKKVRAPYSDGPQGLYATERHTRTLSLTLSHAHALPHTITYTDHLTHYYIHTLYYTTL